MPERMCGVLLMGHGGFEQLQYREDVPIPSLKADEVLIRVRFPRIQGADVWGRIVAVGDQVPADRVGNGC